MKHAYTLRQAILNRAFSGNSFRRIQATNPRLSSWTESELNENSSRSAECTGRIECKGRPRQRHEEQASDQPTRSLTTAHHRGRARGVQRPAGIRRLCYIASAHSRMIFTILAAAMWCWVSRSATGSHRCRRGASIPDGSNRCRTSCCVWASTAVQPHYHPLTAVYDIDGRTILVLWAPGGETRPYKARVSLASGGTEWAYYIRRHSSTVRARGADERELLSLAATVPFDDRYHQTASQDDLSPRLDRTVFFVTWAAIFATGNWAFDRDPGPAHEYRRRAVGGGLSQECGAPVLQRGTTPLLSCNSDRCRVVS